jgi:hypothetical protein
MAIFIPYEGEGKKERGGFFLDRGQGALRENRSFETEPTGHLGKGGRLGR